MHNFTLIKYMYKVIAPEWLISDGLGKHYFKAMNSLFYVFQSIFGGLLYH